MKNTLTLEFRALRPPHEVRDPHTGRIDSLDIWGIHRTEGSSRSWAISIKCRPELLPTPGAIRSGTRCVIVGRLDHVHFPGTDSPVYVVWADHVSINPPI